MATTIKLRTNSTTNTPPVVGDLILGELGLNTFDGYIYMKKNDGADAIVNLSTDYVTYETLNANSDVGTGATQVAQGDHDHSGTYEPANANLLETTDVVNDLTTGGTAVPLSAEMGKTLETDKLEITDAPVFGTDTITSRTLNTELTLAGNGTGGVTIDKLIVTGDVEMQGTVTTKDTQEVNIGDAVIVLNAEELQHRRCKALLQGCRPTRRQDCPV